MFLGHWGLCVGAEMPFFGVYMLKYAQSIGNSQRQEGRSGKMADSSFDTELDNLTNKLVNVTIGDSIDQNVNANRDNVLLLIKERKNKKKGCDIETLKEECRRQFEMEEKDFTTAIEKLTTMGCIKKVTRSGKTTFNLLQPEIPHLPTNQEDLYADFVDFKIYVTETLSSLKSQVDKRDSSLEMKDLVINLLRQELKNTQETLKSVLEQNAQLIQNFSTVSPSKTLFSSQSSQNRNIAEKRECVDLIDEIPFDESLESIQITHEPHKVNKSINHYDQLSEVRSQKHNEFISKKNTKKEFKRNDKAVEKKSATVADKNIERRTEVVVCGDSLLNNIVGNGLSSKKVKTTVRNFPGANSHDMTYHIQPLLRKNRDTLSCMLVQTI